MWLNLVKQEEMYEKRNYSDAPASKGSCSASNSSICAEKEQIRQREGDWNETNEGNKIKQISNKNIF